MAQQIEQPQLSITEQLAFSTVRIHVTTKEGSGTGTGFFFNFLDDGKQRIPAIVTNKHVVKGALQGTFLLTSANNDGTPNSSLHIPVTLDNFESRWIPHPDGNVDLTIMPIVPVLTEASQKGFKPFLIHIDKTIIPSDNQLKELTAVEDILMVGYPIGIWDQKNNYPIFRRGITATHPANDYNGKQEFMIDAACFPGSSGSPVFLFNVGNYVSKSGGTVIGSRFYFLGILYAGPQYTNKGEVIVVDIPTKTETVSISNIPVNLGYVIKSQKLFDFDEILKKFVK
ncbi:MAG: serine protease [Proteobacteria bacterium]|nr:serine protease [Pseudomonadota bacterium]